MIDTIAIFVAQAPEQALLRDTFSLDYDDIISLVAAIGALITAGSLYIKKRSSTTSDVHEVQRHEEVNADVLSRFQELFERITKLERELGETRVELKAALVQIAEMNKLEEFLEARLHEKDAEIRALKKSRTADVAMRDKEINELRSKLEEARMRISKLEKFCRDNNFNIDDLNPSE